LRPWSQPSGKSFGTCDHGHNLQEKILGLATMVTTFKKKFLGLATMVTTFKKKFWDLRPWSQPSGKFFEAFDHGHNLPAG
jgi:hypothetical protein